MLLIRICPFKYEKQPTKCNLCGGEVVFTTNDKIYGKIYGDGKCYLCTKCRAYVGVHKGTKTALGILANDEMKEWKIKCHDLFDTFWQGGKCSRNYLYKKLADQMNIERSHCHFGHFNLVELKKAYSVISRWKK